MVYGSGTINAAILTAAVIGDPTKVYDGTTTGVLTSANYQLSGFASGEGATINPASLINYASKNVGVQTITPCRESYICMDRAAGACVSILKAKHRVVSKGLD